MTYPQWHNGCARWGILTRNEQELNNRDLIATKNDIDFSPELFYLGIVS